MAETPGIGLKSKVLRETFRHFKKNEAKIHPLSYLFWECTLKCNLSCLHCGSDCHVDSRIEDMPAEVFLDEMRHLAQSTRAQDITVVITGGEPLLRKDLPDIGRSLREMGYHWGMVTNGYQLDAETLNQLAINGLGSLTLSLDGLEESHNWLRNRADSFDRTIQALNTVLSYSRINTDVVTCVNKKNLGELTELYQLLDRMGLKNWRLFTISPIGRAKGKQELHLDPEEFSLLLEFIASKRTKHSGLKVQFSCESYLGDQDLKVRDSFFFCRAGIHIGSILADGSVSACPNIDRQLIQGSIHQERFSSIWESRFKVFRDRSWNKTGICANCKEYKHCGGTGLHWWSFPKQKLLKCHYKELHHEEV